MRRLLTLSAAATLVASCGGKPKQSDLPRQPDRWVTSVTLDTESTAKYVGKTRDYIVTTASTVKAVARPRTVGIGDEIEGIRIGAIKCTFHWRDAYNGKEQYMWRGRWACQAGRSKLEVENAVAENGDKRFDYIYLAPASLDAN